MSAGASLLPISGLQCLIKFIRVEMRSACPHPCLPMKALRATARASSGGAVRGAASRTSPRELWRAASSRVWLARKCGGVLLASMIAQKIAACCGNFGMCRVIAFRSAKIRPPWVRVGVYTGAFDRQRSRFRRKRRMRCLVQPQPLIRRFHKNPELHARLRPLALINQRQRQWQR